jgi:hypothetical protein
MRARARACVRAATRANLRQTSSHCAPGAAGDACAGAEAGRPTGRGGVSEARSASAERGSVRVTGGHESRSGLASRPDDAKTSRRERLLTL